MLLESAEEGSLIDGDGVGRRLPYVGRTANRHLVIDHSENLQGDVSI
jgi:hypothetical protein